MNLNFTDSELAFLRQYLTNDRSYDKLPLFYDERKNLKSSMQLYECCDNLFKHSLSFSEGLRVYNSYSNKLLNEIKFVLRVETPKMKDKPEYPYEKHKLIMEQLAKKYKQCKSDGPVGSKVKKLLEVEGNFSKEDLAYLSITISDYSIYNYYSLLETYNFLIEHKNLFDKVNFIRNSNAVEFFDTVGQFIC